MKQPKILDRNKATLIITKLPKEFNNISKLNEGFSKFGTVVNLQVNRKQWVVACLRE